MSLHKYAHSLRLSAKYRAKNTNEILKTRDWVSSAALGAWEGFRARMKWWIAALASFVLLISLYSFAYRYFAEIEYRRAQTRATFYGTTLEGVLKRYQQLPYILSKDTHVIAGMMGEGLQELNARLKDFVRRAGLEAIYLMNVDGLTVAASNADTQPTFVGQNYNFRPYFQAARAGKTAQYFAVGSTTARPGYFIAEAVRGANDQILGIITVKLDMLALQEAWTNDRETVLVSDQNGVIVLASQKHWLYQAMHKLSNDDRSKLQNSRQYGPHALHDLEWSQTGQKSALFAGQHFLHTQSTLTNLGWTVHLLETPDRLRERALLVTTIFGALLTMMLASAIFLRSHRVRVALAASENANARLSAEIEERNAAEKRLAAAQVELERKNKLATLGELAASVTHELGQPIAALKTYIAAAELKAGAARHTQTGFLENIKSISERMDGITRQLRFFAQPPEQERETFDLRELEQTIHHLVQHDIEAKDICLQSILDNEPVYAAANRLRLEQLLINLVTNAIAAVEGQPHRTIMLSITKDTDIKDNGYGLIAVSDSGVGLKGATIEKLQEPFFTTHKSGKGLGLGLAIASAIAREHNGTLKAEASAPTGARFVVRIPLNNETSK